MLTATQSAPPQGKRPRRAARASSSAHTMACMDSTDSQGEGQRAAAFLAAFNDIEGHLREALGAKRSDSFKWMVGLAEKKHLISAPHAEQLRDYAELRNAISHGAYEGLTPIADPLSSTVESIRAIRDLILDPPLALSVLGTHQVQKLTGDDALSDVLEFIDTTGISQFPVYDQGKFQGLLTTDQIARWFATHHGVLGGAKDSDAGGAAEFASATVADVMAGSKASGERRAIFLPRDVGAQETVDRLIEVDADGHVPRAAVITEHGRPHQTPLRIVTASDLAELIRVLDS